MIEFDILSEEYYGIDYDDDEHQKLEFERMSRAKKKLQNWFRKRKSSDIKIVSLKESRISK